MTPYRIVTVERRSTAVVKAQVAFAELPMAERSARSKLFAGLGKLDAGPTGESFTLSRMLSNGKIYIEPGIIVARSFARVGDVVASELPAGQAVHHLLVGPFDQLPLAWPALFAWSQKEGHTLEGRFWQVYGPSVADPVKQETRLYALLA